MSERLQALLELERRGKLPENYKALLAEARNRGLVPGASAQPSVPNTNALEQGTSGLNEGIAALAGTPVDLMTGALNAGIGGINKVTGGDIPRIENPVGGRGTFEKALAPFISDVQPQSTGQRYARRIGQEVGYGAPVAMATGGTGNALLKTLGASTAADTSAALAGQTAREIAPDSDLADLAATILAGGSTAAAIGAGSRSRPKAPTLAEKQKEVDGLYDTVRASGKKLSGQGLDKFKKEIADYLASEGIDPSNPLDVASYPRTVRETQRVADMPEMAISDVERARQLIGNKVAGNANEAKQGVGLKSTIDNYLDNIQPDDFADKASADELIEVLKKARKGAHQLHKRALVENKEMRGESRAATTGVGGNEVNAKRQNIRTLFDDERDPTKKGKRKGFTEDEMKAMETAVFGTKGSRAAHKLGKFSPTSHTLAATLGTVGFGGAAFNNPIVAMLAAPAAAGLIAKPMAEKMTKGHIEEVVDAIMRGGKSAKKRMSESARQALLAELLKASTGRGQLAQ